MSKLTILLIILVALPLIYYLFKNKQKKRCDYGEENCPLADSDYNKVKIIPQISCIECGNCAVESSGCCASCNANNANLIAEHHCSEHNHSHSHNHHHKHDHYQQGDIKGVFSLLFFPLMVGVITYRIVAVIKNARKKS